MESLLEALSKYRAQTCRIQAGDEVFSRQTDGGGLVAAFEQDGVEPILNALAADSSIDAIDLTDSAVRLVVHRVGAQAKLEVSWKTGEKHSELCDLPASNAKPALGDVPLFSPDPTSAISDIGAALADPSRSVFAVHSDSGAQFPRSPARFP